MTIDHITVSLLFHYVCQQHVLVTYRRPKASGFFVHGTLEISQEGGRGKDAKIELRRALKKEWHTFSTKRNLRSNGDTYYDIQRFDI